MTTLLEYLQDPNRLLLCDRQGLHQEEPLDLVCLDPLCRQSPMACSVCFNEIHRYHRVVTLSKFLSDYNRNAKKFDRKMLDKHIRATEDQVSGIIKAMRECVSQSINKFQKQVKSYTDYLYNEMEIRQEMARQYGVQLDIERLKAILNLHDLKKSVQFILDCSVYDESNNMIEVSELLACNNSRILALISKLEYMSLNCQRLIEDSINKLNFADSTIRSEKQSLRKIINKQDFDSVRDFDVTKLYRREDVVTPALSTTSVKKCRDTPATRMSVQGIFEERGSSKKKTNSRVETEAMTKNYSISTVLEQPKVSNTMRFLKLRHEALKSETPFLTVKSSINAMIPQYALAEPNLELKPYVSTKWAVRVQKCRNLSCINTLAIGLAHRNQLERNNFSLNQSQANECYLLTSQGEIILPNDSYNNKEMRFSQGSTIYFNYDPFYNLFEIKKQNGKMLTIKTKTIDGNPLYFCVRMTYASDQVQLIRN